MSSSVALLSCRSQNKVFFKDSNLLEPKIIDCESPCSILDSVDFTKIFKLFDPVLSEKITNWIYNDKAVNDEVDKLINSFKVRDVFYENEEFFFKLSENIYNGRTISRESYDYKADLDHAKKVLQNLKKINNNCSLAEQIAALFHDIERCVNCKISLVEHGEKYPGIDNELRKLFLHPWNSVRILHAVFTKLDILNKMSPDLLKKTYLYILYHDAREKGFSFNGEIVLPPLQDEHDCNSVARISDADAIDFFDISRFKLFFTHPKRPVKEPKEIWERVDMCIGKLSPNSIDVIMKSFVVSSDPVPNSSDGFVVGLESVDATSSGDGGTKFTTKPPATPSVLSTCDSAGTAAICMPKIYSEVINRLGREKAVKQTAP